MAGPSFKRHSKNACLEPLTKRTASYHLLNYGTNILSTIKPSWQLLQLEMIWAACCTAYLGFLRVSEFTSSSPNHSNSFTDLLLSDVAIDSHVAPPVIRITLKQSKTDQYRQGTHIYLGRISHQVCPIKALIRYLDRCGGRPGPLFILPNNQVTHQSNIQWGTQHNISET